MVSRPRWPGHLNGLSGPVKWQSAQAPFETLRAALKTGTNNEVRKNSVGIVSTITLQRLRQWPAAGHRKAIPSSQRRSVADLQDFEPAIENGQSRVEERDGAPDAKVYRLTRRGVLNQIRRFRNATQQSASNMAVFAFMSNS